jgi:hypothetical protein
MIELVGLIMTGPEPLIEGRTFALCFDPQSVALLHLRHSILQWQNYIQIRLLKPIIRFSKCLNLDQESLEEVR